VAYRLCVIPGDGVGQEVIPPAVEVLRRVLPDLEVSEAQAGWACFQRTGNSLPQNTLDAIAECGAALFGAVSSPARRVEGYRSPIVELRQRFGLYANLRPTRGLTSVDHRATNVDLLIVRENTQDLYAGRERMQGEEAIAERVITRAASERIARVAFALASERPRRHVTIVHKANILPITDGLFRDAVRDVGADYPDVAISEMLVDTAAMMLAARPEQFDVIVTTNLFGDILSDLASVWGGGIGMAPSLNLGDGVAIAEPVHGSAPDIAGKGIANPCGAILSAALLLRHHWHRPELAECIEQATYAAIACGARTPDLNGVATTRDVTSAILERL
jgi:homoisocitrate dehydrogenase